MLLKALLATLFISLLPNLLLIGIPADIAQHKRSGKGLDYQNILLCFASGGLLGDVFLHIIPHLLLEDSDGQNAHHSREVSSGDKRELSGVSELPYGSGFDGQSIPSLPHDHQTHGHTHGTLDQHWHDHHSHHHDHARDENAASSHDHHHNHGASTVVGIYILVGFLSFLIMEKVAAFRYGGEHNEGSESLSKGHPPNEHRHAHSHMGQHSHHESSSIFSLQLSKLSPSGILNLFADSLHNFTDGIAIGASFAASAGSTGNDTNTLAIATILSVLFHEIPHELGDFSILIESGFSKWEAIRAQFLTAIAAIAGTYIGYLGRRSESLETFLMSFTAGGFLYIATVTIIPSITKQPGAVTSKSAGLTAFQLSCEVVAFCFGVGFMVAVTFLE